jgi:hypothetical protein
VSTSFPDIGHVTTSQVDGLEIRFARGGQSDGVPILLTSPWPESIYAMGGKWRNLATPKGQLSRRYRHAQFHPDPLHRWWGPVEAP